MLAPLGKSDRAEILLELQMQLLEEKQLPSFSWFYQKIKISELVEAAIMVNLHRFSSFESVTDMWHTLRDWIMDLRNRFVPCSPKKKARAPHGLDHDIDVRGRRNRFPFPLYNLRITC